MTLALLCAAAMGAWPAGAGALAAPARRSTLLVFLPGGESQLASAKGMSVGLMSASQGTYSAAQLALDISQGARIATSAYSSPRPGALTLRLTDAGGVLDGWRAAIARARGAPQLLSPGLLAQQLPGGAAYAGVNGVDQTDSAVAAAQDGRIAAVSLGPASTLPARVTKLAHERSLVVADLPAGAEGRAELDALSRARGAGELLVAVQRVQGSGGSELLWTAAAGLTGGGSRELSSQSTNQRGLLVSADLAPTILTHLRLAVPADMRGQAMHTDGALDTAQLRALMKRLRVISGRRLKALAWLILALALLVLLAAAARTLGALPGARASACALRSGALGVLWAPVAVLIPAALQPSAPVEYATITLACLGLGALTDLLVPWPRAPLAPALGSVLALAVDALAGTQLLMRSLLGPDPILGARFYGIGNELKSGLAVLVLCAVAGALYPAARGRGAAAAMLAAGIVLAVIEGSARIGAGVGGVILVSAATAVATVMLLTGALTRKRAMLVLVSPLVGLIALAAIDLATAHGSGHFTGSVLHARSAGDVRDILIRRYGAAWDELKNHVMPGATALALGCGALGLRRRESLLRPVSGDPVWFAALAGGLTAGVVGALVEDSGPVLLVVAVFALGCVLTYLWAPPEDAYGSRAAPTRPQAD